MTMYNESDWSSLSVAELLEKAQEFAKKAYGNALSSYSFIDRALDRMPRETKGGAELAELMAKAQQVYQTIVEIQQSITHITDTLSQEKVSACFASISSFCMPLRDNDSGNTARQLLNDKKLLIELAVRGGAPIGHGG